MQKSPQHRAVDNYRDRLSRRGLARFEVVGRESDRGLLRTIARQLADEGAAAQKLRAVLRDVMGSPQAGKGQIFAALRRSPLVGAELHLDRPFEEGREIDL
jgi:hypothetical protein